MYPISALFINYLRDMNASYKVKAIVDNVEYSNSHIVDFTIENSVSLSEEFELGSAIPSKLTLKLYLKSIIPPNAKIVPYLALTKDDVGTEWLPLGEFYVDNRERNGDVWTFTCYDKLVWGDVPYISALSYPASQQQVWDEICNSLGYTYDSSVVIDPNYMFGAGPAGFSKRQVLGFIAGCNGANLILRKGGVLGFSRYTANDEPSWTFECSDYVSAKQVNPLKTYTRIVGIYDTTDGLYYEAGQGDDNHTLYIENPFITQQMVDNLHASLNGFSYLPISIDAKGFPHLDQGDLIEIGLNESDEFDANTPWEDAHVNWEDAHFPWDGVSYHRSIILYHVMSFTGGLSSKIEAPSVSEQQSEFQPANTLAQQIALIAEKYTEDSVKLDKAYFGVSLSRTEGLIVSRDDGASKVVLNSDEFTFYQGTEKALYFDAVEGRYVFNGIVEGAEFIGGIITGAEIRTSASPPRISLSSTPDLLEAISSYPNRVALVSNLDGYASALFESGSNETRFTQKSSIFEFMSNQDIEILTPKNLEIEVGSNINFDAIDMDLKTTNSRLRLENQATLSASGGIKLQPGFGVVEVDSWTKLRSIDPNENQTLYQALQGKANVFGGITGGFIVSTPSGNMLIQFQNGVLQSTSPVS